MEGNLKVILCGANGVMGHVVSDYIMKRDDAEIIAGIDKNTEEYAGFFIFPDPSQCDVAGDVIIDFSKPECTVAALEYAVQKGLPIVVATTGLSDDDIEKLKAAAEKIPVFWSSNMSIGVNLLTELARRAARALSPDFDVEIIETHHNRKVDAPSGTALMIADAVSEEMGGGMNYVYDRHSEKRRRDKKDIGISSVRGGTIVGEHKVLFAGEDEMLILEHRAMSRTIFAAGALNAAVFLTNQGPGLYDMGDMI